MSSRKQPFAVVMFVIGLSFLGKIQAQFVDFTIFEQFQFNFSSPGARASAMGRTFIGIANDASTAISNPAGLVNLTKPQVYFEYKHTELRSRRLAEGDSLSPPFKTTTFRTDLDSFSFFNVAYPITDKVAVSFTRHEFLNQKENFSLAERPIPGTSRVDPVTGNTVRQLFFPVKASFNFEGVSYAGSVAFTLPESLTFGLTLSADRLKARASSLRNRLRPFSDIRVNQVVINSEDTALGITVGGLYQPAKPFSVGVSYSKGARFNMRQDFLINFSSFATPPRDADPTLASALSFPFKIPDRAGLGVKVQPQRRMLFAFDVVRIFYSQTSKRIPFFLGALTDAIRFNVDLADVPEALDRFFTIEDKTEVHAGGEINVGGARLPIFLRYGVFTNPNHRPRFIGRIGHPIVDAIQDATFNVGNFNRTTGLTFGAGFNTRHLQADAAYVSIDNFDEFVASIALRF